MSELASLQAQAASSGRADLKDPRRVAEQYLRILYRGTLAAEQNEFGLGEYERSPAGVANDSGPVPFAGAHDVGPGAVHLRRYSWPEGQPDDIWYVTGAVSDFVIGGGEALGDKFEGARFRQFLLPQKDGTLHVFVATFGERTPLIDETFELKAQAYFKVERTFSKKHPVLYLQAQLRSTDGKIGIFETSIPNNENP